MRRHIPATLARIPHAGGDGRADRARWRRPPTASSASSWSRPSTRCTATAPALTFDPKPFEPLVAREATQLLHLARACATTCSRRRGLPAGQRCWTARCGDKLARTHATGCGGCSAILYPPADMDAARAAIGGARREGPRRARSSTSTTCFAGPVRKRVLPILDEMPLEERVRTRQRPHQLAPARRRGDAAAADQRRRPGRRGLGHPRWRPSSKMWALADDIEHVLGAPRREGLVRVRGRVVGAGRAAHARRPPALAVERAAAGRRGRGAAGDVAHLRDHVGRRAVPDRRRGQAGALRRRRGAATRPGSRPHAMQFLLDGSVTIDRARAARRRGRCRRRRSGFEEVVQDQPMRTTVRTTKRRHLPVARHRASAARCSRRTPTSSRGCSAPSSTTRRSRQAPTLVRGTGEDAERLAGDGLSPIEKVMALQRISTFAHFRTDELLALANAAQRVPLAEGATLFGEGAPPSLFILLDRRGRAAAVRPGGAAPRRRPWRRHRPVRDARRTSERPQRRVSRRPGVALRDRTATTCSTRSASGRRCCSSCSRRCSARVGNGRRPPPEAGDPAVFRAGASRPASASRATRSRGSARRRT